MKLTIISALIISLLSVAKCDICEPSHFWSSNSGCSKCFCSGVTNKCHAGSFSLKEINTDLLEIKGFVDWPNKPAEPLLYQPGGFGRQYEFNKDDASGVFIWELPFKFYKNGARSYDMHLWQTIELNNGERISDKSITIRILSLEVNISIVATPIAWDGYPGQPAKITYQPKLSKKNAYIDGDRSRPATRADVMRALLSANKILVVSGPHANKTSISINQVWQQVAVDEVTDNPYKIDSIEVCDCPEGYSGDSCESCTGRLCKPCKNLEPCEEQCNDRGICLGCPQCLECSSPYHRNINNKTASVFGACESSDPN